MNLIFRHILFPALAPLLFFSVAATPVEFFGCRTRGLLALTIALVGVLAGLSTAIMGAKSRLRRDPAANWWISSLILAIPAIAVLIIASSR